MPRTRYGTPLWIPRSASRTRGAPSRQERHPRLTDTVETDVAVVGAGLTGTLIACQLARAGRRVVLLEADRAGATAALDAGWIVETPGVPFRELRARHGLKAARHLYEATRKSALDVAAFLRRLGTNVGLDGRESLLLPAPFEDPKALEREQQARAEAGLDAVWLPPRRIAAEVRVDQPRGGLKTHSEGVVDPYRAWRALLKAALAARAALYEQSPVTRVKVGRRAAEVVTPGGLVRADAVVIATGTPRPLVPSLQRHVRVDHTYAVATEPLAGALRPRLPAGTIVRTAGNKQKALTLTREGRVLVQGGDQPAVPARRQDRALVQRAGELMYELSVLYPALSGVQPEFAWAAPRVTARDGLMLIGPHRNLPRHLFALGLGATGLSGAWLAARVLLRRLAGEAETADETFGFGR